jgi:hypothetical protein
MPAKRKFDRVYKCEVHPCSKVKGEVNHWFVAGVDKNGRFWAEHFTPAAAETHGAIVVCSENCLHIQLTRWADNKITAKDRPANPSPAVVEDGKLTAWISSVYKTNTQYGPARILNYKDNGRDCQIWCFVESIFHLLEMTAGTHSIFQTAKKGEFTNVVDVIAIDGAKPERINA